MKNISFFLLLFIAVPGLAQQKENCRDVVFLRNGSILRGKVTEYNLSGDLAMTTWGGAQLRLPASKVRKVKQYCRDDRRTPLSQRPYSFRESGWYHATRAMTLVAHNEIGLGVQHSSGLMISRWLGVGVGVGVENLAPDNDDVTTYPLFGEVRGYFLPRHITPFYALAAGWGFADQKGDRNNFDRITEKWRGGWMAQGQIGYRMGNHFTIHLGLRLQRKTRTWDSNRNLKGVDRILHKRFDIGLGILL